MSGGARRVSGAAAAVALAALAVLAAAPTRGAPDEPAYVWPVQGVPIKVTGGMGERRADHPHAGIDISLFGKAGVAPIVSIGAGQLLRMRTSKHGYGNALYVRVNRGWVAVYAHLNRFSPRLERLAAEIRARTGRQRIDYYFEEWEPPVTVERGEVIAFGGKSGTATPHLHFELRKGETEAVNPLVFGFQTPDDVAPTIAAVRLVPLSADARIEDRAAPHELALQTAPKPAAVGKMRSAGGRKGRAAEPAPAAGASVTVRGRVGVAVDAYDRQTAQGPLLPPYRIETVVDGKTLFATTYSGWDWRDRRLWMVQYEPDARGRRRWWRAYNPHPVEIPFFSSASGGTLDALDPGEHKLDVLVSDPKGITTVATATIRVEGARPADRPAAASGSPALFNEQTIEAASGRFALETGAFSLLEPARVDVAPAPPAMPGAVECYAVGDPGAPTRRGFTVRFNYPAGEKRVDQLAVFRVDGTEVRWLGSTHDASQRAVRGDSVEYGAFCLARDNAPPEIENLRFAEGGRKLTFLARDALSGMDVEGLQVWAGDQRAIVSFSPRSGKAAAHLPERARPGEEIVIVAVDRVGNAARRVLRSRD
jgi:hypothetical protein